MSCRSSSCRRDPVVICNTNNSLKRSTTHQMEHNKKHKKLCTHKVERMVFETV